MAYFNANKSSGNEPILIGSYSGNQNINVSDYLKNGDTANNFFVVVSGCSGNTHTWYQKYNIPNTGGSQTIANPFTITKTLSGNTLSVGGMVVGARVIGYAVGEMPGCSANINWQLYYIG